MLSSFILSLIVYPYGFFDNDSLRYTVSETMEGKNTKPILVLIVFLAVISAAAWFIKTHDIAVLNPSGTIGSKERRLIIESTLLMLIVVIPVYVATFTIAWRYREGNSKAKYSPELDHSRKLEFIWWIIPTIIITILGVITYKSSHELDPAKSISSAPVLKIQVVALQWKWLFIYPQQNVATVNYAILPVNKQVDFQITSDAPMNSFWIPKLGGQIYAMSGMATQVYLIADTSGSYRGLSANISGAGFSNMNFVVNATPQDNFNKWIKYIKTLSRPLSPQAYATLSQPNDNLTLAFYSYAPGNLFDKIIQKYNYTKHAVPGSDNYIASRGGLL